MGSLFKTGSCFCLFAFLLFLLSATLCISCVRQIDKPIYTSSKNSEASSLKSVDNFLNEAFLSYQQGQLTEAIQKLETALVIAKEGPKWTTASLLLLLRFFQEKTGEKDKALVLLR